MCTGINTPSLQPAVLSNVIWLIDWVAVIMPDQQNPGEWKCKTWKWRTKSGLGKNGPGKNGPGKNGPEKNGPGDYWISSRIGKNGSFI